MGIAYPQKRFVIEPGGAAFAKADPQPLPRIEVISSRLEDQRDHVIKPFYTVRLVSPACSTHHGFSVDRHAMIRRALEVQEEMGGGFPIIVDPLDPHPGTRTHPPGMAWDGHPFFDEEPPDDEARKDFQVPRRRGRRSS